MKPTSYKVNGFIHRRISAEKNILFKVFDFFDNKTAIIFSIAIIPARATEAEAPETKMNIIIDTIITYYDIYFPNILFEVKLRNIIIYAILEPETASKCVTPLFLKSSKISSDTPLVCPFNIPFIIPA